MSAEERLAELLREEPDLHALMLAVGRAWLGRYQPGADHAALYAFHPDDTPPVRITIPNAAA